METYLGVAPLSERLDDIQHTVGGSYLIRCLKAYIGCLEDVKRCVIGVYMVYTWCEYMK